MKTIEPAAPVTRVRTARTVREEQDFRVPLDETGWYHSMEFPDGSSVRGWHTIADLQGRWAEFGLPADLTGKRLLDIGAWDGWFTFEAERRGADVVALDYFECENFLFAHRKMGSKARYVIAEVYDLPRLGLGKFDYVLFLGVLYHLRHPLLALEYVCAATEELAIVDSFVLSGDEFAADGRDLPYMEFYETDELGNNVDNWVGPTPECLLAFCRSAGFVEVELLSITHRHARVACRRKWNVDRLGEVGEKPFLQATLRSVDSGLNFSSRRDEYVSCWFDWRGRDLTRLDLLPEVGGYGSTPLVVKRAGDTQWLCNFRLPPGLEPGWHDVRVGVSGAGQSNATRIAFDVPVSTEGLLLHSAFDGVDWRPNRTGCDRGSLVLWLGGLAENCDRQNIRLHLGERRLEVFYVGSPDVYGLRQVNARLSGRVEPGKYELMLRHGEGSAGPMVIEAGHE
jgi:tRNA (mo5U34)-methyltransferase